MPRNDPLKKDFNLNCLRIIRTVDPKQSRTVEQDGSRDPLRCAFCRKIAIPYTAGGKKSSGKMSKLKNIKKKSV